MTEPEILPYGDSALLVRFKQEIDIGIHRQVMDLAERIEQSRLPGFRYLIPAYCTLTVAFDPGVAPFETWQEIIGSQLRRRTTAIEPKAHTSSHTIPVCYDLPFALDMPEVEAITGLQAQEIVEIHTRTDFRVFMLGFLPGFAYLGSLPDALYCPRKTMPRKKVPMGAVGIAGKQTGIYPSEAPGGWRIIGRTPLSVFDPRRDKPFLFQPGDTVRFQAIPASEWPEEVAVT